MNNFRVLSTNVRMYGYFLHFLHYSYKTCGLRVLVPSPWKKVITQNEKRFLRLLRVHFLKDSRILQIFFFLSDNQWWMSRMPRTSQKDKDASHQKAHCLFIRKHFTYFGYQLYRWQFLGSFCSFSKCQPFIRFAW